MNIRHFRELEVYKPAKAVALDIFGESRTFPAEENFSLTDQVRKASRSVCANIAEAWRKRKYRAAFVATLSDSLAESAQTQVRLEFALEHEYITKATFSSPDERCEHVVAMLIKMSDSADDWILKS
jgi:four helix bundle protein